MIIVHHLEHSRSQRVLWLLEELGLDYEVRHYSRDSKTMLAPPELKRVHPLGKSPVVEDQGRAIAETGAIVEYLVEKADGRLGPPANRDAVLRYRHFLHYAEGSLMPPLFTKLVLGRVPLFGKAAQKKFQPMIDVHLDYVECELASRPWFAGEDFTAADIMMVFPFTTLQLFKKIDLSPYPNLTAYLARIGERPAYKKAMQIANGEEKMAS